MPKNKLVRNKISSSTQQYLDIAEIKDDVVVMRDGTLRGILLVSSINFALKSEEEQNAIISSYVSFLNNIDFPLQITIQSRELNIDNYIEQLKQKEKEQINELLKIQTNEYIGYINELISMGKIMNKHFYVNIPYNPMSDKRNKFFASLFNALKPVTFIKTRGEKFLKYKNELNRRIEIVTSGLESIGLNAIQLDSQSLIELFYNIYNPVTSKNQPLEDIEKLRIEN